MRTQRRTFLKRTALTGAVLPLLGATGATSRANDRQARMDAVMQRPVLKRSLFKEPVILESVELLRRDNSFLCRVRSKDGAEGLSVAHSDMHRLYPIFVRNLQPFFVGKDARDLDLMLERIHVYGFNFRYEGIALGLPLATIEFAILDLLGRMAGKPMGELIGEVHHPEVPVYVATEWRELPLEASVDRIREAVAAYDARALKIKVGYLMFMTTDMNARGPVGKTEKIIPLLRDIFGPDMALYADANSYYEAEEAIRVGRLLQENRYAYFEEPVRFDDFEAIKRVADALEIPIANGEQDRGFVNFRWLLANDGIEVVQPDSYYFGGMIRSVQVGRLAEEFGKTIVPHMSGGRLGFVYNCHLVSVLPNAGAHHEFKGLGTDVPFECSTSPLKVMNGTIKVPTGPGLGVEIDPDYVAQHEPVTL
ncbi:MAG: hypothetical protein RI897_849 [Verrucomicrobiota bacterium]|jgi:L-alanine-DL-glutamate epimerase-like enolase superfamily enzyme